MQVQVKFIVGGANSAFGGFSAGDTLRCNEVLAKHLVEEIKCARYMDPPAVIVEPEPEAPKRGRKPKAKES